MAVCLALGFEDFSAALPHAAVDSVAGFSVVAEGGSERWIVDLGGVLVAALSPELPGEGGDGLFLLVRPPREPRGPRRLLHLRLEPGPRLDLVAASLGNWIESLAAIELVAGAGPELIAGGDRRLVALGALSSLSSRDAAVAAESAKLVERPLLDARGVGLGWLDGAVLHRGVDLRVAALEPGRLRLWAAAGGAEPGLGAPRELALPLAIARTSSGLRLSSPPVARVLGSVENSGELYLSGPEAVGSTRLRCHLLDAAVPGAGSQELWAALPGPESVQQSWPFEVDGVPVLVVRTQAADELNLFERQRLRVLTLSADRTRSGAPPTLAVELDSKRWHETAVALGDVDGDGHDDLLAAFPEGLSGTDLVAQWWRGNGGGRFESRPHRSDIQKAPAGWALVPSPVPGLLLVGTERMEFRPFSATGRNALVERSVLAASIPALAAAGGTPAEEKKASQKDVKKVTVSVGGDGESSKVTNLEPDAVPLGAVELDRRPGLELLAVQGGGNGNERLILLRARPQ